MEVIKKLKDNINLIYIKYLKKNGLDDLPIFYINGSQTLPPPLTSKEEEELLNKIDDESSNSRKILVEHNLRLVVYIAKKFENTGVDLEDLISIGTIGLMKAINTFNNSKNIKLATYASRCIENEILMFLRRSNKIKGEVSIDEPLNQDGDGNELLLSDLLGTDEDVVYKNLEDEVDRRLLKAALSKLDEKEKNIMNLRFGMQGEKERTQKEVADMLGISQSYISRLEKKIMTKMRKDITSKTG
ncbi:MAG: RNA polymerase sporulation sigma factor SigE [Clostridia bacterium]|nr:RNA polymerase sporulation sigma factor SigE [Clostridia bacterium]